MLSESRQSDGRFGPGNPGGPGRPRRAVEADFLRTMSEAVPLDAWRRIIDSTVAAAEQGDSQARAWLAKYLLGTPGPNALTDIAADESDGLEIDDAVARAAKQDISAVISKIIEAIPLDQRPLLEAAIVLAIESCDE